ncbi:MAG TPA: hypothetical protein VGN73_04930 [Gemmatimonadaceae bacterium]|jgi:hypothetical protein|nr:hypothetical protein [Gemmatimonadaceae bacterium]
MTYPHHSRSNSPDGYAVRPGTSAALTARTIDATIHPPLVRAQETVIGLVPRMVQAAAPLTSPLFLSAVALTLVFIWVAIKMRYRPSAILLSALLVMGLTSFRPAEKPLTKREIAARRPRTTLREYDPDRWSRYTGRRAVDEPPPPPQIPSPDFEPPIPPSYASPPMIDFGSDPGQIELPPIPVPRINELTGEVLRSAERMLRDNEQMRAVLEEARIRMREELRHRRWRSAVAGARIRSQNFEPIEIDLTH